MSTAPQPAQVWFPAVQASGGRLIKLSVTATIANLQRHKFPPGVLATEGPNIIEAARHAADHAPAAWLNPHIKAKFSPETGWSGKSYGLALVIADILACLQIPTPQAIYATGILGEAGAIDPVGEQSLGEKLKLLADAPEARGSRFFYPAADDGPAVAVALESLRAMSIQTHAVGHVDEVLALLWQGAPSDDPTANRGGGDVYHVFINNGLYRADTAGSVPPPPRAFDPAPPPTATRAIAFQVTGLASLTRLYLASAGQPITLGRAAPQGGPLVPLPGAVQGLSREHLCIEHHQGRWTVHDPRPGSTGTLHTQVAGVELLRGGSAHELRDGDTVAILQGRITFTVRLAPHWLCFDIGNTRYLLIADSVELGNGCLPMAELPVPFAGVEHRAGGFVVTARSAGVTVNGSALAAGQSQGLRHGEHWHLGEVKLSCTAT